MCIPECPVEAIYKGQDVPEDQQQFFEINQRLANQWPVLTERKDPPADHNDWADIRDKIKHLAESW